MIQRLNMPRKDESSVLEEYKKVPQAKKQAAYGKKAKVPSFVSTPTGDQKNVPDKKKIRPRRVFIKGASRLLFAFLEQETRPRNAAILTRMLHQTATLYQVRISECHAVFSNHIPGISQVNQRVSIYGRAQYRVFNAHVLCCIEQHTGINSGVLKFQE